MPALSSLLSQTMMFISDTVPVALRPVDPVPRPAPVAIFSEDLGARLKQPLWSWSHDPGQPVTLTDVTCLMRAMGVQYRHAMNVCTSISFDEVSVTLLDDTNFLLPLEPRFAVRKYTLRNGHVRAGTTRLFPLEKELDASLMVVFAYEWDGQNVNAIREEDLERDDFMPRTGTTDQISCGVGEELTCFVGRLRLLVACEFAFFKERNDFVPVGIVGMAKVHPHAYVMSNTPLKEVSVSVTVQRPRLAERHDSEMLRDMQPKFFADANVNSSPVGSLLPFVPFWDQAFDYYEIDPIGRGVGVGTPIKMVDSKQRATRTISNAIKKLDPVVNPLSPAVYVQHNIVKVPRQGEFDNLHLAPRMKVADLEPPNGRFATTPARFFGEQLDSIAMAPFCLHDCFHLHTRWGLPTTTFPAPDPWNLGFGPGGAYTEPGAPGVPLNQDVFITLLPPSGFLYEAVAAPAEAGSWHVFFHHGMGYAVDFWKPQLVDATRAGVEALAISAGEENFSPVTAANSFALFYWRLRFGGLPQNPAERILILNPGLCRS